MPNGASRTAGLLLVPSSPGLAIRVLGFECSGFEGLRVWAAIKGFRV